MALNMSKEGITADAGTTTAEHEVGLNPLPRVNVQYYDTGAADCQ